MPFGSHRHRRHSFRKHTVLFDEKKVEYYINILYNCIPNAINQILLSHRRASFFLARIDCLQLHLLNSCLHIHIECLMEVYRVPYTIHLYFDKWIVVSSRLILNWFKACWPFACQRLLWVIQCAWAYIFIHWICHGENQINICSVGMGYTASAWTRHWSSQYFCVWRQWYASNHVYVHRPIYFPRGRTEIAEYLCCWCSLLLEYLNADLIFDILFVDAHE